jgi:hypothetical protein
VPFIYWPSEQRYRNERGHWVSQQAINQAVDSVILSSSNAMRALTASMQAGSISLSDWQVGMMAQMKLLHLGAAMVGRGGRAQMTQSDWGWTGQRLRTQYAYLRSFATEMATGRTPLDGRLQTRAAMYADAARGTQRGMMGRVAMMNGRDEERNQLGGSDRHCGTCLGCSAQGWVAIGSLPAIGSRSCLSNCHCSMQYRSAA